MIITLLFVALSGVYAAANVFTGAATCGACEWKVESKVLMRVPPIQECECEVLNFKPNLPANAKPELEYDQIADNAFDKVTVTVRLEFNGAKDARGGLTSIGENTFTGLTFKKVYSYSPKLVLSRNNIDTIHTDAFGGITGPYELWLNYNKIPNAEFGVGSADTIKLGGNPIRTCPTAPIFLGDNLSLQKVHINMLSLDEELGVGEAAKIQWGDIPSNLFDGMTLVENLHLNGLGITSLGVGVFDNMPELYLLQLNGNKLTGTFPKALFANNNRLETFYAEHNEIGEIEVGTFDGKPLEEIGLTNNKLTTIEGLFQGVTSTEGDYIYLANNLIEEIPAGFIPRAWSELEYAYFDDNKIKYLPGDFLPDGIIMSELNFKDNLMDGNSISEAMAKVEIDDIDLTGNPMVCKPELNEDSGFYPSDAWDHLPACGVWTGAAPTEAPVAASTEAPVPASTEAPVAASTEAPVAASTEAPVAASTEAPIAAPGPRDCNVVLDDDPSGILSCRECAKRRPRKGKPGCAFDKDDNTCKNFEDAGNPLTNKNLCVDPRRKPYPCLLTGGCCHGGNIIGIKAKQKGLDSRKRPSAKACYTSCANAKLCEFYRYDLDAGLCTHYRSAKGRTPKFSKKEHLRLKFISGEKTCDPTSNPR